MHLPQKQNEIAGCDRKVRYASRQAAGGAIACLRSHRRGYKGRHRPYRCPHCLGWHIGRLEEPLDETSRRKARAGGGRGDDE